MKESRYVVVDPIHGPVLGTEASTRIKAWRAFVCSPSTREDDVPDAIEECTQDGFKVMLRELVA